MKKKLKLEMNDLCVDSFASTAVERKTGTVRGAEDSDTWDPSCGGNTCYYTCPGFITQGGPLDPCVICG
jgi:hypothetical protein